MSFGKSNNDKSGTSQGTAATDQTTNYTQTPTNPDWVTNLATSLGSNVSSLEGTDPQSYIAGANPLLTTAAANATNLSGTPWDYNAALDVTGGVANAKTPDIAGNISAFMNPYLDKTVAATNAALDHSDSLQNEQDNLALAGSGAFGGSGAALTKAATRQAQGLARGTTIGNLESQGFNTALGGATSQAQLQQQQEQQRLQAGQQMANIADQYGANSRANITAQDAAAQPLQQISQAQAQAPLTFQQMLDQLFAGTNPSLFTGQTGTQQQNGTQTQTGSTTGSGSTTTFGFGGK